MMIMEVLICFVSSGRSPLYSEVKLERRTEVIEIEKIKKWFMVGGPPVQLSDGTCAQVYPVHAVCQSPLFGGVGKQLGGRCVLS